MIFTPSHLLLTLFPAVSVLFFASVWTVCVEECVWVWVDSSSADATYNNCQLSSLSIIHYVHPRASHKCRRVRTRCLEGVWLCKRWIFRDASAALEGAVVVGSAASHITEKAGLRRGRKEKKRGLVGSLRGRFQNARTAGAGKMKHREIKKDRKVLIMCGWEMVYF